MGIAIGALVAGVIGAIAAAALERRPKLAPARVPRPRRRAR
jgi:hypothetical protein